LFGPLKKGIPKALSDKYLPEVKQISIRQGGLKRQRLNNYKKS
jgi:hypothetical protein